MQYVVETVKNLEEACLSLEKTIDSSDFGILHMHNMEKTMYNKGVKLGESCCVYEICNPHLAKKVLDIDMSANMLLPCRISIYTEKGITKIGMINPSSLMQSSLKAHLLLEPALFVEEKLQSIINASK